MEGLPNLPPHLQGEFMKQMENMQMKDSLRYVLDTLSRTHGQHMNKLCVILFQDIV